MISLITLTLLLFEFQHNYGHTLPRKEMLKNLDFYSIQGSNNESITLVSSKSKNPTVKEITYYHVIERPYEKNQVMGTHTEETAEGPDFDDTKRPFTNSHGLQFSDLDSDDDHDDDTSEETECSDEDNDQSSEYQSTYHDGSDSNDNVSEAGDAENANKDTESNDDTESDENISESGDDKDNKTDKEGSHEKDDVSEESTATDVTDEEEYHENDRTDKEPVESITSTEQTVSSEVTSEGTESVKSSAVKMAEPRRKQSTSQAETVLLTTEPVSTTAVDDVANEKKAARNMLFNQLRDRYQKSLKPSKVSSRKKRNAEYVEHEDIYVDDKKLPEMPEAPILPELNYDQLPTYVREMIFTEKPVNPEQNKEDDRETDKEIEHRIEEVINEVMKPYEEELEELEGSQEEKPKKPRTYGMKLNAGKGYVWNDLLGSPGMSFDVGDSTAHFNEEDSKENLDETPEYEIEPYDKDTSGEIQTADDSNLEDIFIDKDKDKNDDNNKKIQETEVYLVNEEDKLKGITESDLHDNKLEHTDNKMNESQEKEIYHKKRDETLKKDVLDHIDTKEKSEDESTGTNHDKIDLNTKKEESSTREENIGKDMEHHKPRRIESMLEVLKDQDEDFWMWLQDWTSTYMDLLMKHIKKIVQQEVKKQIELNNEHLPQDKTSEKSETAIETQTDEKETEQVKEIIKEGRIIVDGVKIPLTHTTNFIVSDDRVVDNIESDLLKGRRHKEKQKDKNIIPEESYVQSADSKKPDSNNVTDVPPKKERTIAAKNIFGNSYNNDKVTNIYFFYLNTDSRTDSKKIIEDLTSDNGNKSNTLIFGHPENTNVDQREETSTENKKAELEPTEPIKEESGVITEKVDEITAHITPTGEKKPSPAIESSNKNEELENKDDKRGNDKEFEEIHKEKEDSMIDEKDTTSEEDRNVITESSHTVENKVDGSENNSTKLEESPKENSAAD